MIRFEHLDVLNWHNAIRGMRNSWESWDAMDSKYESSVDRTTWEIDVRWVFGPNDYSLALRLARAGSDHAKYRRQIIVSADIIAGNEFWKEFDTYKVGTTANSTSLMHKLGSRLLTMDDFSFDQPYHPDDVAAVDVVNRLIEQWWAEGRKVGTPTWRQLQKRIPMGIVYRRTVTMNYEVLANIYRSRRGHRLAEWREFCEWIENLPYSSLITLKEKEAK